MCIHTYYTCVIYGMQLPACTFSRYTSCRIKLSGRFFDNSTWSLAFTHVTFTRLIKFCPLRNSQLATYKLMSKSSRSNIHLVTNKFTATQPEDAAPSMYLNLITDGARMPSLIGELIYSTRCQNLSVRVQILSLLNVYRKITC